MPDRDPLTAAIYRISENQNALGCAIAELAKWADSCGNPEVAEKTRHYLQTLLENSDAISKAINELNATRAERKNK